MRTQRPSGGRFRPGGGPGIPLFTAFGIRIFADWSWVLVVALIAGTLTVGWFPTVLPGRTVAQYLVLGFITAFFFFASVLLHELSHSVVARMSGIPVPRITLFLFGGRAEISREPSDPRTEVRITLAGPAASAVLAACFWAAVVAMGDDPARPGLQLALFYLALSNTLLLAFNLLPGLPLDGGLLLRAGLWAATKDLRRATRVASLAGKAIAGLLVAAGLLGILTGKAVIPGLWFIFIALFLSQAADASLRRVPIRDVLEDVRVGDVMTADVVTVQPGISLSALVNDFFLRLHFTSYPVLENGRAVGMVAVRDVKSVPRERWDSVPVRSVMTPLSREIALAPSDTIATAVAKMKSTGAGRLPVVENGKLAGILTRSDVMNFLEIRSNLSG